MYVYVPCAAAATSAERVSMSLSQIQTELKQRMQAPLRQDDGSFLSSICFDQAFCGFDGHFVDNPIVPAVCLISAAELMAAESIGSTLILNEIMHMKFKKQIIPNEIARFKFTLDAHQDGKFTFSYTITKADDELVAKIKLVLVASR